MLLGKHEVNNYYGKFPPTRANIIVHLKSNEKFPKQHKLNEIKVTRTTLVIEKGCIRNVRYMVKP